MDWLSEYDAHIDCKSKKVTFRLYEDVKVEFRGHRQTNKFLTILHAKRLLRQRCEACLVHVVDAKNEASNIEDITMVNEFLDVFPDKLPGLPPDMEI